MWGFYCDIESNQVISEPFIFEPRMECVMMQDPSTSNTLYYAGIVLMVLSLIPVNLLYR
jgi:hypothetical protein